MNRLATVLTDELKSPHIFWWTLILNQHSTGFETSLTLKRFTKSLTKHFEGLARKFVGLHEKKKKFEYCLNLSTIIKFEEPFQCNITNQAYELNIGRLTQQNGYQQVLGVYVFPLNKIITACTVWKLSNTTLYLYQ